GGVRHTITLTATADTNNIKIYSKAEVSSGSIFAEVNYGQKNALTEQIDALYSSISSANAILAILSQDSTFDTLTKSSPYTYTLTDAGTAWKQLLNTINAVSGASTVKMMYKIESTNAALKIQSRNGNAWGGNEKSLTADGTYHEIDLPITSGQVFSGWGVYSAAKSGGYQADVTMIPISANGVFFTPATAILYGLMDTSSSLDVRVTALTGKLKIGSITAWINNGGYPFGTFQQVNDNRVNYANASGVYSEMYANINVPSGGTVTLSYLLNVTSGRLFVRLA
ncbi:hypothetical protein, partial [Klebsiella pneumoniae]|uniref:hypothetical protein n=1 Tax=Klebsiella pneumoniae TaxID=573 RepID=UPI003F86B2FE